jgi:MtrB/PioB family decaheme-associated outer membrane protein
MVSRNDDSGTWITLDARNLGLDSRAFRFDHNHQGDWGYFFQYDEIPRSNPYLHNTALAGLGLPNVTVNGAALETVQLETERKRFTLGGTKWFGDGFSFDLRARDDKKSGERQFGRGTSNALEFLTDPIDQSIRQVEATLGYVSSKLHLSGGYYGTSFNNKSTALNITGGNSSLAGGTAPFTPIALPPDNQSHQVFLSGGYRFTPTTQGNFKVAYAKAEQDDDFIVPSSTGRTNLGGKVDTTQVQLGLTARPMPKLSLLANFRYEDRDDKTPVFDYFPVTTTSTATGENEPRDIETTNAKVEASYYLPGGFRLTAGIEDDIKNRNTSSVRVVSYREETDELSYRLELRRSISETITGSLAYVYSDRGGSDFQTTVVTNGTVGSNLIAPIYLADRDRNKVRLLVDWTPTEPLSLQFLVDYADDDYSGRTPLDLGVQSGKAQYYSVDATYVFSDAWQASAWVSHNDNQLDQTACVGASSTGVCPANAGSPIWGAQMRNVGDSLGISLDGKILEGLDVGAELQYMDITDEFDQQSLTAGGTVPPLPDISTKETLAKVHARYALPNNATLGVELAYDLYETDDWTWSTFGYVDGTRVFDDPQQDVFFVGVTYTYRWR